MDSLGARIKSIRELKGITQERLAEKCSVTPSCVSRWETNDLTPKKKSQEKIACALGVEIGDLYSPSSIDLPSNIIIREIIDNLLKMNESQQNHMLKYVKLFQEYNGNRFPK